MVIEVSRDHPGQFTVSYESVNTVKAVDRHIIASFQGHLGDQLRGLKLVNCDAVSKHLSDFASLGRVSLSKLNECFPHSPAEFLRN